MSGSLKELKSRNVEDAYFLLNPQHSFYKHVFKRHTHFAKDTLVIPFNKDFTFGSSGTINISNYGGDLLHKLVLQIKLNEIDPVNSNFAWVRNIGHAIISRIRLVCGSIEVDNDYGTQMDVYTELTQNEDQEAGYKILIGDVDILTSYNNEKKPEYVLHIPLNFWFTKNVSMQFPLLSCDLSPLFITVTLSEKEKLFIRDDYFDEDKVKISDISFLATFYYLNTDEKKYFITRPIENLIHKLEFSGVEKVESQNPKYNISFDRPHKELIWCMKNGNYLSGEKFIYYTNKDDWYSSGTNGLNSVEEASCKIIKESFSFSTTQPDTPASGEWIEINIGQIGTIDTINITNNSGKKIWYNPDSLTTKTTLIPFSYTTAINLDVTINNDDSFTFENVSTELTVYELSFPVKLLNDGRNNPIDPIVYQFNNYGVLIDGSINPIIDSGLIFNGKSRIDTQSSDYFNIIQPFHRHTKIPKTGILSYSFSIEPENYLQPSGTENLSKINNVVLTLSISPFKELGLLSAQNELWIFGKSLSLVRFDKRRFLSFYSS